MILPGLVVTGLGVGSTNPVLSLLLSLAVTFSFVAWETLSFATEAGNTDPRASEVFVVFFKSVDTVVFEEFSEDLGISRVRGAAGLEIDGGLLAATGTGVGRSGGSFGKGVGEELGFGCGVIIAVGGFFVVGNCLCTVGGGGSLMDEGSLIGNGDFKGGGDFMGGEVFMGACVLMGASAFIGAGSGLGRGGLTGASALMDVGSLMGTGVLIEAGALTGAGVLTG